MIFITIKTTENYISIVDVDNSGRCYDFRKPQKVTEQTISRLFMDLAIKTWMNSKTLFALKEEIIRIYPEITINWQQIEYGFQKSLLNGEKHSIHVKPRQKEYNQYRR